MVDALLLSTATTQERFSLQMRLLRADSRGMKRTRIIRTALVALPVILTGCATAPTPVAVSDAAWAETTFTVVSADGFTVGDSLGMTMLSGFDVRLADVIEPYEFGE